MKKVIGAAVLLFILTGLIFFVKLNGNGWVCKNGEWVKQGTALSPKPTTPCNQAVENQTENSLEQAQTSNSTTTPVPTANPSGNIVVDNPKPGETLSSQFTIKGRARVFENQLNFRVRDLRGNPIVEGTTNTNAEDAGQFGSFETVVSSAPRGKIIIEVFDLSAKDGSEIDKVTLQATVK
jgi:hypothetical protein